MANKLRLKNILTHLNEAIEKDSYPTNVIFLKHEFNGNDDVYAFFPDEKFDSEGNYASYSHIGQHSACSLDYVKESTPASPEEYADLKNELEGLGYNLNVETSLNESTKRIKKVIKEKKEISELEKNKLYDLAKKHFALQQKISSLSAELEGAVMKAEENDDTIKNIVSKIKGKSIKLGKIFIKLRNVKTIIRGKETYSYKGILHDLREAIDIEAKIINPIIEKHKRPATDRIDIQPELTVTKEAINKLEKLTGKKIVLKENGFTDFFKRIVIKVYKMFFSAFSNAVDNLWIDLEEGSKDVMQETQIEK